jgi:phospholipid transport system transporter-binding protein
MNERSSRTSAPLESPELDQSGNVVRISGSLTFETVAEFRRSQATAMNALFAAEKAVTIDLESVTRTDSAGLALLLHWLRAATRADSTVELSNLPTQLLAIARTCKLDAQLPISAG